MIERQTESGLYAIEGVPTYVAEGTPGQGIHEAQGGLIPGVDPDILDRVSTTMTEAIDATIDIRWLLTEATQEEINSSQEHIQLFILALERITQLSMDKLLAEKHGINYDGPDVVFGHSVGEIAALIRKDVIGEAYGAALTYERARLMAEAGRLASEGKLPNHMGEKLPGGAMVVMLATEEEVDAAINMEPVCKYVEIAAFNGDKLFTVSGPKDQLAILASRLRKTDNIPTNVAVHNDEFMGMASIGLGTFIGVGEDERKFKNALPGAVVLNGLAVTKAIDQELAIVNGVSEPVMFNDGAKLVVSQGVNKTGEDGLVLAIEVNPTPSKLLPMMRDAIRPHANNVVKATFGEVMEFGLDARAIQAAKKAS